MQTNPQPPGPAQQTAEGARLAGNILGGNSWTRWGPYLSERQWATVREDYSPSGDSWGFFPHDHARSRVYRWGEDGLLGICDYRCLICFALALWNGKDSILKERLFGLTNAEGNHGEDVKECYFYLDSTPTHSYLKGLYKYPQAEFPYAHLIEENRKRGRDKPEFELVDTGVFDGNRYFDVQVEYAKATANDILIRITAINRGPEAALLHLLPTFWARNTWDWGRQGDGYWPKAHMAAGGDGSIVAEHTGVGRFRLAAEAAAGAAPTLLFTENETNNVRLFRAPNQSPYVKDAFHEYLVHGKKDAVNPAGVGTKAAFHYALTVPPKGQVQIRLRLFEEQNAPENPFDHFEEIFAARIREADEFYAAAMPAAHNDEQRQVARQGYAGMLWSKQFYYFVVKDWLEGDPTEPKPPPSRTNGRNADWPHVFCRNVLSMPDKWEYPWFASWDLMFHLIPLARVDPEFAKSQLVMYLREWYMHPNGHLPAYEYNFDDVNPPVQAWAAWRIYKTTAPRGQRDRAFLDRVFQKLLVNFTWWVNRKDVAGKHLFAGGFLGLDNVSVIDRSMKLPPGVQFVQADGTAWMAFYCLTMLAIALELAPGSPAHEDMASKFFEHFLDIADAMNTLGGAGLWNEEDGFYYDGICINDVGNQLKIRSVVGLIPLLAVELLDDSVLDQLPGFQKRLNWLLENRKDLARHIAYCERQKENGHGRRLLAIPSRPRLERALRYLLDEKEFLSPFGIRSLSRFHKDHPFVEQFRGHELRIDYAAGEAPSSLFGGNSNWRGPIWFPINYLLVEALERYHHYYGNTLLVECPTGSGHKVNLLDAAHHVANRLCRLFMKDNNRQRPCDGADRRWADDPHWRELLWFHEYFHGDDGHGLGANHQTGWTALVLRLLDKYPLAK